MFFIFLNEKTKVADLCMCSFKKRNVIKAVKYVFQPINPLKVWAKSTSKTAEKVQGNVRKSEGLPRQKSANFALFLPLFTR